MGIQILEPEAPKPKTLDTALRGRWYLVHSPARENEPFAVYLPRTTLEAGPALRLVPNPSGCCRFELCVVPLDTLTIVSVLVMTDVTFEQVVR